MKTVTFKNTSNGYASLLQHGVSTVDCIWDTGASGIVINTAALSKLVGCSLDYINKALLYAHPPKGSFTGYPSTKLSLLLCRITNLAVAGYLLEDALIIVDTNVSYDTDGFPIKRTLVGRYFSDNCSVQIEPHGDCIMIPDASLCASLNRHTESLFKQEIDKAYSIDYLELSSLDTNNNLEARIQRICNDLDLNLTVSEALNLLPSCVNDLSDDSILYALNCYKKLLY